MAVAVYYYFVAGNLSLRFMCIYVKRRANQQRQSVVCHVHELDGKL